jgi:hypothetical protein
LQNYLAHSWQDYLARLTLSELVRASSREIVAGWTLNSRRAASAAVLWPLARYSYHLSNLCLLLG